MEQPPVQTSKQGIKYYNGSVNGGRKGVANTRPGWCLHVDTRFCTLFANIGRTCASPTRINKCLMKIVSSGPASSDEQTSCRIYSRDNSLSPCSLREETGGVHLERDERIINLIFSDTWICRFLNSVYQSVYC